MPQKKRGRPRLRVGGSVFSTSSSESASRAGSEIDAIHNPHQLPQRPIAGHKRSESNRSLNTMSSVSPISPRAMGTFHATGGRGSIGGLGGSLVSPTAWLDLDFNILKQDDSFDRLFGNGQRGPRSLSGISTSVVPDALRSLKDSMKRERESRDPTYLPPILLPGEDSLGHMDEVNEAAASRGFNTRTYQMHYYLPNGTMQTLPTSFTLAKTTRYFVIMTLPPISLDSLSMLLQQADKRPQSGSSSAPSDFRSGGYQAPMDARVRADSKTWSSSPESRDRWMATDSPSARQTMTTEMSRTPSGSTYWERHTNAPQPPLFNSAAGSARNTYSAFTSESRASGPHHHGFHSERHSSTASSAGELDISRSISNESSVMFSDDEYGRARSVLPAIIRADGQNTPSASNISWAGRWPAAAQQQEQQDGHREPERSPDKRRKMDIKSLLH